MQSTLGRDDVNIRSPRFFLARTTATCRHCHARTQLFALAVPSCHEVLDLDDEAQDEELAIDTWRIATDNAFLFHITFLPVVVRSRLEQFTQFYRTGNGEGEVDACWANHCEQCGCLLDDHELFCEPDGPFLPTNAVDAGLIRLLLIDEAFEAAAAGYGYDPPFFDAMTQA